EEVGAPDHEEDGHQPVHQDDQVVDLMAVRRGIDGHPLVEKLSHRKRPPLIRRMDSRRALRERARRQKATNIAPRPTCTKPITPRRKKMPLFVPLTMAELGSPKQTGQAERIWGTKRSAAVTIAFRRHSRRRDGAEPAGEDAGAPSPLIPAPSASGRRALRRTPGPGRRGRRRWSGSGPCSSSPRRPRKSTTPRRP